MSAEAKRIGLLIGREKDWPEAFITAVNSNKANVTAELVKLAGTRLEDECPYAVIIDRMSHEIPYYRAYVKHAAVRGSYIINDPFVWSSDNRFLGATLAEKLGLKFPRTIVLPNKEVETDVVPDSFRNLLYPMDWEGIIDYVGVPAIFKEIRSGGRRLSYRVHSVEELIQQYDESGTHTMILQQLIEEGENIHCFVIGGEQVMPLRYLHETNRYAGDPEMEDKALQEKLISSARRLSRAYGYDINVVEFLRAADELFVVNATNPSPLIDRQLLGTEQFEWLVEETVKLAIERAKRPLSQRFTFQLE